MRSTQGRNEKMSYRKEQAARFADHVKSLGFTVYMAESGTYGFITDKQADRVMSFQFDLGGIALSGNYKKPVSGAGTGWVIAKELSCTELNAQQVADMLHSVAPLWATKGATGPITYATVADHMANYGTSSKFELMA